MGLESFLTSLFASGRVRVAAGDPVSSDLGQVNSRLAAFERDSRHDLPAEPPEVSLEAARYGALMLYRACQFLVFRDTQPEVIQQELGRKLECPLSPSAHYSVDLTLRFLPDIVRLARAKSQEDPLVAELMHLAGRWPLSSVGIAGTEIDDTAAILADRCLLQLYVDRVIARGDFRRLEDEQVRSIAVQAIGAFPELAPDTAAELGISNDQAPRTKDQ